MVVNHHAYLRYLWILLLIAVVVLLLMLGLQTLPQTITVGNPVNGSITGRQHLTSLFDPCLDLTWQFPSGTRVDIQQQTQPATGTLTVCDVPYLPVEVVLPQTSPVNLRLETQPPLAEVARAILLFSGAAATVSVYVHLRHRLGNVRYVHSALLTLLALMLMILMDVFTNTNRSLFGVAVDGYSALVERGFSAPELLRAPYVFRFLPFVMVGYIAQIFQIPIFISHIVMCYAVGVLHLVLAYTFVRQFGASHTAGVFCMLVLWLSIGMTKNNIYFYGAMESLAQVILMIIVLSIQRGRFLLVIGAIIIGMFVREFTLVGIALTIWWLLRDTVREKSVKKAAWLILTIVISAAIILIPRLAIRNIVTEQYLDPFNNPTGTLENLLSLPFWWQRNLNILLGSLFFVSPLLLLLTPRRLPPMMAALRPYRVAFSIYIVFTLILILYGGTDIYRYAPFLFIPFLVALGAVVSQIDEPVLIWEMLVVLGWMLVFNRAAVYITPHDFDRVAYLNFWPAYHDLLNRNTFQRLLEFLAGLLIINGLRRVAATRLSLLHLVHTDQRRSIV
jgi:hypothetical protein